MTYRVPDEDIAGFYRDGYIIFRGILPDTLVRDLRRECDKAVKVARRVSGAQAQRLQPLQKYEGEIDLQPFRAYAELPDLVDAIQAVLTAEHKYGQLGIMGVLFEPEERAWCTNWHRDMTLASSRLPLEEFHDLMLDWNHVNQVNCALYDDDCTWFVPGSHLRMRDLPGEVEAARLPNGIGWGKQAGEAAAKMDPVALERACLKYTQGMPGAVQFKLHAGDFALYRPIGWHIGNYVPYKKRATLHDGVVTPHYEAWWHQWIKGGSPRWEKQVSVAV